MKLQKYFDAQQRLDDKVVEVHGLEDRSLTANTMIALYVELGELANEIEFFKHWKINKRNDKTKQFDEWSDVLHFMLSLGNKYGHSERIDEIKVSIVETDLFTLFQTIYTANLSDIRDYVKAFDALLTIGHLIGMSSDDQEDAYFTKNQTNYDRLASGY